MAGTNTTKLKITKTAWRLFHEKGYNETTVDDIVAESGTSKGSFYHYYSCKDELLSSLSDLSDAELLALAEEWEPELPDDFFTYQIQGQAIQIKDQKLGQALSSLLPKDREIILLYYFLGLRDEAVANRLNMSRATVQRRREKAQKKLKMILEESL